MSLAKGAAPIEKGLLQACIAIGGLVPVGAGLGGSLLGLGLLPDASGGVSADSHMRYLSGLLLAVGFAFWSTIPRIDTRSERFRLLTFVVAIGGAARLYGLYAVGRPSGAMWFALAMELLVTPLLCVWQGRIARLYAHDILGDPVSRLPAQPR